MLIEADVILIFLFFLFFILFFSFCLSRFPPPQKKQYSLVWHIPTPRGRITSQEKKKKGLQQGCGILGLEDWNPTGFSVLPGGKWFSLPPSESQFSARKEQSPGWIAALEDRALTHLGYKISGLGREPVCTPRNENPHPCSLCVNLIYRLLFPPTHTPIFSVGERQTSFDTKLARAISAVLFFSKERSHQ